MMTVARTSPRTWSPLLLLTLAVTLGHGCKLVDEGLNNEQLKEFREEGEKAGAGLKLPEGVKSDAPDEREAAPQQEVVLTPKSGGGLAAELVEKRLRCGSDTACSREMLEELRKLGPLAEPALVQLLDPARPTNTRVETLRVLAFLRARGAIPAIGKLLEEDKSDIAREALWALGHIGDARAIEPLARVLKGSQRTELRDSAAQALGSLRDPDAAAALVAAWPQAPTRLRASIVSALGQVGDAAGTPVLLEALQSPDAVTRLEAINALEAVGALAPTAGDAAVTALERLAADASAPDGVRARASQVLAQSGRSGLAGPPSPSDVVPDHL
jgi:hypothetical protein